MAEQSSVPEPLKHKISFGVLIHNYLFTISGQHVNHRFTLQLPCRNKCLNTKISIFIALTSFGGFGTL